LSLHHHFDQPVMHREDFDVFFERIKAREVGLTIDTAHLAKSGITDAAEVITSFGPFIDNFHLKDFAGGEWRVLGEGVIDFAPIFGAIGDIRYSGWISADEESGGGIIEGMRACLTFMREGLEARPDTAIGK
jgi:sugar phosphate isomerase/epimerase